jgi:formate hydrogenlyase transcriptional activator
MAGEATLETTPERASLDESVYQSLLDVSKAILVHRDPGNLFKALSARLRSVLHFDFLNLILHDAEANVMRVHILEAVEPPVGNPLALGLPPDETPSGWVLLHQQRLVLTDVEHEERWPRVMSILRSNRIRCCCYFPLTTAQHRVGSMGFGFLRPEEPPAAEIELMEQIAAQVAVAVDNALNYESAARFQGQLSRERDRLRVLLEITNAVVSELETHELLEAITSCLMSAVPHDYASLALFRTDSNQIEVISLKLGESGGAIERSLKIPNQDTPLARCIVSGKPGVFERAELESSDSEMARRLLALDLRSLVCLPLIHRNHTLGGLNLASRRDRAFAPADVEFLTQIAAQLAIAIENAMAYRQIAELKDQIAKEKLYLEDEIRTEQNFGEIVGDSRQFRRVLSAVQTVAPTDATVLILGETGTGKELIARAIHDNSGRREHTFVKLNCAAIPTGLLERSYSDTSEAHSPAQFRSAWADSNWRTRARFFSTRSATFLSSCSPNYCARCRSRSSSGSAARGPSMWTCGWWRRRIATSRK